MQHQQGAELADKRHYCDYIKLTARYAHEFASNSGRVVDIVQPISILTDMFDNSILNNLSNRSSYVTSGSGCSTCALFQA